MPSYQPISDMKRHEITARLREENPDMLASYAHYMAGKMQRLIQRRDLGWYAALRILGLSADPTALTAIKNTEAYA